MQNFVRISKQQLEIKEFENQRVVTFNDIDTLHKRAPGTAGRNFRENKEKFLEGEDFYFIKPADIQNNEIRRSEINNAGTYLITESGYLMLVKSLTDDLAWEVQRQLVNDYFRAKNAKVDDDLSIALQMNKQIGLALKAIASQKEEVEEVKNEVKRIASKVDTFVTSEDVIASDIARLLNLRSESGIAHNNLIGAIAKKLGFKVGYKHNYQDENIKIIPDDDGKGFRTYYRPAGADKIIEWFKSNKDTIYYRKEYQTNSRYGRKGEIKEHGYVVNGIHYKVQ